MDKANPKVGAFLANASRWQEEFKKLRAIALGSQLTEELKWRLPCYTYKDSNIVIIQGFKDFCALMFFKGVLLKDADGILEAPGENSRTARRASFTSLQEIEALEPVLKEYIQEAIALEDAGAEVELEDESDLEFPQEFQEKYDEDPALRAAFDALTPGRRRAYVLYFSQAKQSKTRSSRVDKVTPKILEGKGLNDR